MVVTADAHVSRGNDHTMMRTKEMMLLLAAADDASTPSESNRI
jgi:hypothetical protein